MQKELQVDGARLFDVDASNQIVLISRRLAGIGGTQALTKVKFLGLDKVCASVALYLYIITQELLLIFLKYGSAVEFDTSV